jgi:D-alanyl-D-alanine carboxypeptidase (penicillin-binding protein 5/6)
VGIPKFSLDKAAGEIPGLPFEGKAGILVALDTGKALWAENADKPVPIASMTKMMTALLAFEDLRDGKIKMDTKVKISKKAASIGGSDIWLDPRETVSFRDLLKAMLIKSANDAAYQIAERLGG